MHVRRKYNAHTHVTSTSSTYQPRTWKDVKLAALRKAQILDLTIPTKGNRAIYVAMKLPSSTSDITTTNSQIIGCCEVIEEKLDINYNPKSETIISERERKKTARYRPVIENLAVKREFRRNGIALALLNAIEADVKTWIPIHDEVFAQVKEGNIPALEFFKKQGFTALFVDPTCTQIELDGIFMKETTVSKVMTRKILHNDEQGIGPP